MQAVPTPMMTRTVATMSRCFIAPLVLIAIGTSQGAASPYLWWKVELREAQTPVDGLTFVVYGSQPQLDFVITFVNEDSEEALVLPPDFIRQLRLSVADGDGRSQPVETRWSGARLVASRVDYKILVEQAATLGPSDRVEIEGAIVRTDGREFMLGDYNVTLDVRIAAKGIRTAIGGPWSGRYEPQGAISVQLIEPRNPSEQRAKRIIEAQRALDREESLDALSRYLALVQTDARDIEARVGAGRAYLQLGRFREAATELETVLPSIAGHRSLVYLWLAHAYVGTGDTPKAESLLRQLFLPNEVPRQIQAMREDVNRPGRRR